MIAEGAEAGAAAGEFGNGDGEPAEVRALLARVRIGDYLAPAAVPVPAWLAHPASWPAALSVPVAGASGGVAVPWEVRGPRSRRAAGDSRARARSRATANNDGSIVQRPILQRLFGPGGHGFIGSSRGRRFRAGRAEWPLISAGCRARAGGRRHGRGGGRGGDVRVRESAAEAAHRPV